MKHMCETLRTMLHPTNHSFIHSSLLCAKSLGVHSGADRVLVFPEFRVAHICHALSRYSPADLSHVSACTGDSAGQLGVGRDTKINKIGQLLSRN